MIPAPSSGPAASLAETCRVVGNAIPLWPYHRDRLERGGCTPALLLQVEAAVRGAIAGYQGERTSRLRLHLEVTPEGEVAVEIARALSSLDVVGGPVLVPVALAELPPLPELPPGGAKPGDRSWWDAAARLARRRGGHQALIADGHGTVIDGSSASVWIVPADTSEGVPCALTPPAPPAIAGVARAFLLDSAHERNVVARVEPFVLRDLEEASEVFLTNAFGGAVGARGRSGPVFDSVRRLFQEAFHQSGEV